MQETMFYLMHRNDPVCTVTGKTIYRVNNHHFWHKKSYQNRPKKTPRHSAHFQSGKILMALRKSDFRTVQLSVDRAGTWRKNLQHWGR